MSYVSVSETQMQTIYIAKNNILLKFCKATTFVQIGVRHANFNIRCISQVLKNLQKIRA